MDGSPVVVFVIPVSSYHIDIAERAIQSALDQTIPCRVVVVYDHDHAGAGWARNRGIEQVDTPFLSLLDADDWIEPEFAEKCLRAYTGERYIYTDWNREGETPVTAPECAWDEGGSHHIITTLLPTAWVKYVGGFDEQISGEDTDFYWKLTRAGLCGKRLPEALFTYGKHGQRGKAHVTSPQHEAWRFEILRRYGDKPMGACCNDSVVSADFGMNAAQPGDVLARWLVDGQRQRIGGITGRIYRKFGNALTMYMSPADVDHAPNLFARVVEMPPPVDEEAIQQWRRQVAQMLGGREPARAPMGLTVGEQIALSDGGAQIVPAPNVERVLRMYINVAAQSGI